MTEVTGTGEGGATTYPAREDTSSSTSELNATATAAIKAFVDANSSSLWSITATTTGTDPVKVVNLDPGYYYITTTTGTVVAINSTNPTWEITDKNTVPSIDKKITAVEDNAGSIINDNASTADVDESGKKAIAQVGKKVTFNATITIGKGAKGYEFRDNMESSLKLDTATDAIKVYKGSVDNANVVSTDNYTLDTTAVTTGATQYTFKIDFKDTYTSTLSQGDKLIVVYSATVTSDALQTDPATNSATISWGDNHTNTSTPSTTDTYNAKITVTKNFQSTGEENLAKDSYLVAGFVLRRGAGTEQSPYEYYKYTAADPDATPATDASVTWVKLGSANTGVVDAATLKSSLSSITEKKTTASNNVIEFTGLPDGVYTLIETTTPDGYNTAADQQITIKDATDASAFFTTELDRSSITAESGKVTGANLTPATTIRNLKGSVLPSTGGIGTTIFYVIGGVLIAGAAVLLIARKRKRA